MSTRTRSIAFVVVAVVVAGIIMFGLRRRRSPRASNQSSAAFHGSVRSKIAPPAPAISLQINGSHELTVFSGTPLILRVRVGNLFAQNAALQNEAATQHTREIQAGISRSEISPDDGKQLLARLPQPAEVPTLTVGDDAHSWQSFVHFFIRTSDGQLQPFPWPLTPESSPVANSLVLDQHSFCQLEYLLAPEAASAVVSGTYQIAAVLDVPQDKIALAGLWNGRVESGPVKLNVVAKPARFSKAEEEEWNLEFVRYFRKAKDTNLALQWDQKALAVNAASLPALVLLGELKEDQNDWKGALESYQSALSQFEKKYPDSYEPPQYLILKTSLLLAKLRSQVPQGEK